MGKFEKINQEITNKGVGAIFKKPLKMFLAALALNINTALAESELRNANLPSVKHEFTTSEQTKLLRYLIENAWISKKSSEKLLVGFTYNPEIKNSVKEIKIPEGAKIIVYPQYEIPGKGLLAIDIEIVSNAELNESGNILRKIIVYTLYKHKKDLTGKQVVAVKKFETSYKEYKMPWGVIKLPPLPNKDGVYDERKVQYITPWGLMEFPSDKEKLVVEALRSVLSNFNWKNKDVLPGLRDLPELPDNLHQYVKNWVSDEAVHIRDIKLPKMPPLPE